MTDSNNHDAEVAAPSARVVLPARGEVPVGPQLMAWLRKLLANRRLSFGIPAAFFVLVVGIGLISNRRYSSTLSFVPQVSAGEGGGLGSLVASLGVSLPTLDLTQSPDFYSSLIQSNQFLHELVDGPYVVRTDDDTLRGSLILFYGLDDSPYLRSRERAIELLRDKLLVRTDPKSGIVRVTVRADYAALAYQIAERTLSEINRFNNVTRHAQAGQEREFIARRVAEARRELQIASDSEVAFLDQNRQYQNSADLIFEHDRLDREVSMRTDLYSQLMGKYDQARIDEARNTPRITIVESPVVPPIPDKRGLLLKGILAILAGLVVAAFVVYAQESMAQARATDPDEVERLTTEWHGLRADVSRVIARGRGLVRRRARS
jgi:uncharacterized protein involved in exopolysaccharide biosynthesis